VHANLPSFERFLLAPTLVPFLATQSNACNVDALAFAGHAGRVTLSAAIGGAVETSVARTSAKALIVRRVVAAAGLRVGHLVASGDDLIYAYGPGW
jgi:hypothetical protein